MYVRHVSNKRKAYARWLNSGHLTMDRNMKVKIWFQLRIFSQLVHENIALLYRLVKELC